MSTFGSRLREERDKLGLNQTDFAKLAGQSRGAQAYYERDERSPDARYLSALSSIGIDVLYLLTGQRAPKMEGMVVESEEEKKLLENYRVLDDAQRLNVQAVSDAFASAKKLDNAAND